MAEDLWAVEQALIAKIEEKVSAISLRTYIATQVLVGQLANTGTNGWTKKSHVKYAFDLAELMVEEAKTRDKKGNKP